MDSDIDLRGDFSQERRKQAFERLDDIEPGAETTILLEEDPAVLLNQYRITRGRGLDWEQKETNADGQLIRVTVQEELEEDELVEFDVRDLPPQRRHTLLLETFDDLDPGRGFVLVNDHDPKPLYYELQSTRGDTFQWEYLTQESQEWKVEIIKTEPSEADDESVLTKFDVRSIPKEDRHPSIHHRYGMIPEGETMAIVAPHEPRPLREEFQQRYGDTFSWDVVAEEAGRCEVHITKQQEADGEPTDVSASAPESVEIIAELDVRDRPPAQRHEMIFEKYDELQPGEAFELVNDHDPKPLYHQFEAEAGEEFRWAYLQEEPGEFRVVVGKAESALDQKATSSSSEAPF